MSQRKGSAKDVKEIESKKEKAVKGKEKEGQVGRSEDKKVKDNCPTCHKTVVDDDWALECEMCDEWYHIKCQGIEEDEYDFLNKHKSVHWYCNACNKSV